MKQIRSELPRLARQFLRTPEAKQAEVIVRRFHRWLDTKQVLVSGLYPAEVENFCQQPFRALVTPRTAYAYKRKLAAYLAWLYKREALKFNPSCLGIRRQSLPPQAWEFLRSLKPTHKLGTWKGYRSKLYRFHQWVDDSRIRLKRIQRSHMEQWLLSLTDEKLHPATRTQILMQVRCYLRWLFEREELKQHPDDLVRTSDFPKLPSYLPRPLPPDTDQELQQRLEQSNHFLWKALLLMRHTGLRVGELLQLEYNCIRMDHTNQRFLKVPLGKLDNERLVPITQNTQQLIQTLQENGSPTRPHLLEKASEKRVQYTDLTNALHEACRGLHINGRMTSHRLRHTYATSLLNGGMSLYGIMKLLGHRDYRMTLRYTAITQESIGREYLEALTRLENKYPAARSPLDRPNHLDPIHTLTEIVAWIRKNVGHDMGQKQTAQILSKRLIRLQKNLQKIIRNHKTQ